MFGGPAYLLLLNSASSNVTSTSMRDAFRHHHKMAEAERKQLWKHATFALDANVLLNIYRYTDATREDFFRVLRGLRGRLWIPHQAALEFYRRRLEVIQEQGRKYDELENSLERSVAELRSGAFRKSAFLKIDEIESILRPAIDRAKTVISQQRANHPDLIREDVYLETLTQIVGSSLGLEPSDDVFESRCLEAQKRIDKLQPPGYRDAKKTPPERYGDTLIWFELLEHAQATKKPIIFITDDDKEDWWQIINGEKLGPRTELRAEMRKHAGVDFSLYNPAYLLQSAEADLDITVAQSSIEDAHETAKELQRRPSELSSDARMSEEIRPTHSGTYIHNTLRQRLGAEAAVARWLADHSPNSSVVRGGHTPFALILRTSDGLTGVDVKTLHYSRARFSPQRLRDLSARAFYEISTGSIQRYRLFLVTSDPENSWALAHDLFRGPRLEPTYPVSIGFVDTDGQYKETVADPWTARYAPGTE